MAIAEEVVGSTVQERLSCTLLSCSYKLNNNQEERT